MFMDRDSNDNTTRLRSTYAHGGESVLRFRYGVDERRRSVGYPNGITASYGYVPGKQSQLRKLEHRSENDIISSFTYSYDLNDFVTQADVIRSGITVNSTQNFTYDNRNQLSSATKLARLHLSLCAKSLKKESLDKTRPTKYRKKQRGIVLTHNQEIL